MTADMGGSIGAATVGSPSVGGRDRCWPTPDNTQPRHPITGRFLAFDCEVDCQKHCAGLCGVM